LTQQEYNNENVENGGKMKKTVIITLTVVFCLVTCTSHYVPPYDGEEAAEYEKGYTDGKIQAGQRNQQSWMIGGCGGAWLLGLIGGGLVTAMAYNSTEFPPYEPKGTDTYKRGFMDGYQDGISSKKGSQAMTGCLLGTLVNVAVLILILSANPISF